MKREELDRIIKKALELQSRPPSPADEEWSEEDLEGIASRLGIPSEILEKATRDIRKEDHQCRLPGTPDEVREKFLQQILAQTAANASRRDKNRFPLDIDRGSLVGNSSGTVCRIFHRKYHEISCTLRFVPDGADFTTVSWSGNTRLGMQGWLRISLVPLFVIATMIGSAGFALPTLIMILTMAWATWMTASRVEGIMEENLGAYFDNLQLLGDLHEQAELRRELSELRASAPTNPATSALEKATAGPVSALGKRESAQDEAITPNPVRPQPEGLVERR